MRIVAWNLGHKIKERPIHARFHDCIAGLAPDVLMLNEYVHGSTRESFVKQLAAVGLSSVLVSTRHNQHNQVLIASRFELEPGDLAGPGSSPKAHSNFLHCRLPELSIELVGMRVPAHKKASEASAYWADFKRLLQGVADRKILFAGDLNADAAKGRSPGDKALSEIRSSGWKIPEVQGPWSYWRREEVTSRVDHAIASPRIGRVTAQYVSQCGGVFLAGGTGSVSDHAALAIEID